MKATLLLLSSVVALAVWTLPLPRAQAGSGAPVRPAPPKDCSGFSSEGCSSFGQMLRAGDTGILAQVSGERTAYVCFQEYTDAFLIASFQTPGAFVPKSKLIGQAESMFDYSKYTDGVRGGLPVAGYALMTWTGIDNLPPSGLAHTAIGHGKDRATVLDTVDPTEIDIAGTYQNIGGTATTYSLQIRRSTLRYKETFEWNKTEISNVGRCVEYQGGKITRR